MFSKENSASDMLHYIEEIESLSKLIIQEFETAYPAVESDINFHLIALKNCAYGILVEIDKVHHDRVGIESVLPDDPPTEGDNVLFNECIRVVGEKIRANGIKEAV